MLIRLRRVKSTPQRGTRVPKKCYSPAPTQVVRIPDALTGLKDFFYLRGNSVYKNASQRFKMVFKSLLRFSKWERGERLVRMSLQLGHNGHAEKQ